MASSSAKLVHVESTSTKLDDVLADVMTSI